LETTAGILANSTKTWWKLAKAPVVVMAMSRFTRDCLISMLIENCVASFAVLL